MKIWSSKVKPPASAMDGMNDPLVERRCRYSRSSECSSMPGTPHSFIIRHGLIPVPPPAASTVRRSSSASEAYFTARARSSGRYAPVLRNTCLAPSLRSASTRWRNESLSTIPTREWRSNSWKLPFLNDSITIGSRGSGSTT